MIPVSTEMEGLVHPISLREDEYLNNDGWIDLLQQVQDSPAEADRGGREKNGTPMHVCLPDR